MSVRILDEHDVRRLLPMGECIDVMAEALASLARGELHNPLRFVVRPPGEQSADGADARPPSAARRRSRR